MLHYKHLAVFAFILLVSQSLISQSFKVEVGDDSLTIAPRGRVFVEGATYVEDKTDLSNGASIADLRLGIGLKYKQWETKVEIEFTDQKLSSKDIYLQYTLKKNSLFRVGHFPEPFGMEYIESSSNIKFLTASAATEIFSPDRKLGIDYRGWNDHIWYSAGIFGDGDAMRSSKDGDDGYAATGRFVYTPMKKRGSVLHIGIAGSIRKADANGREEKDGVLRDKARQVVYSAYMMTNVETLDPLEATITDANYQAKYALELAAAYGPVSMQTEYFHSNIRRYNDAATYQAQGAYAQVAVLLLGGHYGYASTRALLETPDPKSLELVGRFGFTDLDDRCSNIYGGTMRDWSFATNYYLNRFIVLRLTYTYMNMGDYNPVLSRENIHAIQGRIQFTF